MPRPAAIFDLDGTLLQGGSAERLLVRRALRARVVGPGRVGWGVLRALRAWAAGQVVTPGQYKAWLTGAECRRVEALAVDCVHSDVVPRLRPALLRALERHRAEGCCIVLLSGTPDFLADELARFLHADAGLGSCLERAGGRFTGHVLPPYPYGEGKLRALRQLAGRFEIDLGASHAYANRASDAAHLQHVGHAVAVAPDVSLRRLARERGWPVLEDRDAGTGSPPGGSPR